MSSSNRIGDVLISIEAVNGNGGVDDGEFAVACRIDGAGFITLQHVLF